MKVSRRWFNQYLGRRLGIERLVDLLVRLGFGCEVEGVTDYGRGLENVVVARIEELAAHPQDRHLKVAGLKTGRDHTQVVTAAKNVKPGDLVLLAQPGTVIKGATVGEKDFAGTRSKGMFVSEQELGLAEASAGVIVLDPEMLDPQGGKLRLRPGQRFADAFDTDILDLETTAVRADWWSVLGIARELCRVFDVKIAPIARPREKSEDIGIRIRDRRGCPLYTGRIVKDVQIADSPFWLKWRLFTHGINPINNVVDVTNLVMLQLGQPLHAFDYHRLEGHRIVVRRARRGEMITTLDGTRLELTNQLMICDAARPVAFAGVVGGLESGIRPDTRDVLIESAYFDPIVISHASKMLNVRTESSIRFEKGVDVVAVETASYVTANLLAHYAGGKPGAYQKAGRVAPRPRLTVSHDRIMRLLSLDLGRAEFIKILKDLDFAPSGARTITITVPSYRNDLKWEADIAEEVARCYGYDLIPEKTSPRPVFEHTEHPASVLEARVKAYFVGKGFYECCSLSLVSDQDLEELGFGEFLKLKNPLSEKYNALRPTMLANLISNLKTNVARSNFDLRLFEVGRVFVPTGEKLPQESLFVGGICGGAARPLHWSPSRNFDFFDAKGFVADLFTMLKIENPGFIPATLAGFRPGQCAQIVIDNKTLGCIGLLDLGLAGRDYYYFDLNLDEILARILGALFIPLARFPVVIRDLSFLVELSTPAAQLLKIIKKAGGPLLKELEMFDYFSGGRLPAGKKNLGFRLVFRSEERTLKDEEVERIISQIEKAVLDNAGATLRKA